MQLDLVVQSWIRVESDVNKFIFNVDESCENYQLATDFREPTEFF